MLKYLREVMKLYSGMMSGIVVDLGGQGRSPAWDRLKICERLVCLGSWMLNAGMTSLCSPDVQKNMHCIQKGSISIG